MAKAVYSGTFDPITMGHMDIIKRAAAIFDEVTVAILNNPDKTPLFLVENRVKMVKEAVKDLPNVKVDAFSGFLYEYAKANDISVCIRGLRTATDFEYELPQAQFSRELSDGALETLFLPTSLEYAHLSSSAVKEIAKFKGRLEGYVPDCILDDMYDKFQYK